VFLGDGAGRRNHERSGEAGGKCVLGHHDLYEPERYGRVQKRRLDTCGEHETSRSQREIIN